MFLAITTVRWVGGGAGMMLQIAVVGLCILVRRVWLQCGAAKLLYHEFVNCGGDNMTSEMVADPAKPIVDTTALREVADGVYVISGGRKPLVCNIGIVLGSHSALVIDCGMGRRNGEKVLEIARQLAGARKLFLTVTHFHPEHGFGAEAFKGVATIVYNQDQASELADKGEGYLAMFAGMGPDIAETLEDTKLVEADQLYEGAEHWIDLGGRQVILKTWGAAHTRSDQIVFLPQDHILFTGDLAEERTFPIFPWFPPHDADIDSDNWITILDACISELNPEIVVPGHGDVGDVGILTDVRNYIADISANVAAMPEKTPDEILAALEAGVRAAHPRWYSPEWIAFAVRYFASKQF